MCNLYRMRKSIAEVAGLFAAPVQAGANFAEEVYPGYPGVVVTAAEVEVMIWGFPRAMTGRDGRRLKPRAVTNARADRLHTLFWQDSFLRRRCLIPVSAWAEAEGERGRMTRTWFGVKGEDPFFVGGIWRHTPEWGTAFAMVMVDGCAQMTQAHDRMPVVIRWQDRDRWLRGPSHSAFELCRTCDAELTIERTSIPWAGPRNSPVIRRPVPVPPTAG